MVALVILTGVFGMCGCQGSSDPNSPALRAMQNSPNSCGVGGTANINDCGGSRGASRASPVGGVFSNQNY
jgi:hypothetical protein